MYGQAPTEPPKQQFGFDAAGLFARFFNFSGTGSTGADPFYLTYRKYGEKKNTRLGVGFALAVEGDGNDGTNFQNSINFRFGTEQFKDFGQPIKQDGGMLKWRAFYGWDGRLSSNFTSFGSTDNSSFFLAAGPAPFFGLQFRINKRLSISSEIAYNILLTFRDSNGTQRFGLATAFDAPTSIYVNYDF